MRAIGSASAMSTTYTKHMNCHLVEDNNESDAYQGDNHE